LNVKGQPEKFQLISRIFSLLLRLLHGEEQNEVLFFCLREGVNFLNQSDLTEDEISNFECIIALRILSILGYIGKLGEFDQFITSQHFTNDLLLTMSNLKTRAIFEINKSLKETHL